MSSCIATRTIHGATALVTEAQSQLNKALSEKGPDTAVAFPSTAYYLPTILGMTARATEKMKDLESVLELAQEMLIRVPSKPSGTQYLDETLNAGMATLFAAETIEALRCADARRPEPLPGSNSAQHEMHGEWHDHLTGPIEDDQVRSWGTRLADGCMPRFALILGCAASNAVAAKIIHELRRRNILCFLAGNVNGRSIIDQLQDAGVELGSDACVVPLGTETTSAIHAIGFVTRAAIAFGRLRPGMAREIIDYCKNRLPGCLLALGEVDDLMYATASGSMCFGLPLIAASDVPRIVPANGTTSAQVVPIPFEGLEGKDDLERAAQLVQQCIEVRGLKVKLSKVELPVPYGPAFEEEGVRDPDLRVEFGGNGSRAFEFLETVELDKVIDGKIEIVGPDFSKVLLSGHMDLGLVVQVAGSRMKKEFEPLLERQIHSFLNRACGIEHSGRRDAVRIRVSNAAATSGLGLESLGKILAPRFHEDFGGIVDKVQVKVVTDPASHVEWLQKARASFDLRDRRLADLTDVAVEESYSCTLRQSVMPDHVCVISPERPGPCGAYNWLDCKSMFDIDPSGPNQPIKLGRPIDLEKGSWDGINGWVAGNSRGVVNLISMYSLMRNPLTASGCSDCVVMLIPEANGVMIVSREDSSMTPAGLTFAALSEIAGSGMQTPGVMGVGKSYLISPKFISADGGFKRVVWMSSMLKQSMSTELKAVCKREGDPDFMDKIADEGTATSVHELLAWLELHDHPALAMEPIF